jgi:hypothetical protein
MIPRIFCGKDYRDWPRWVFWKTGHREHEYRADMTDAFGRPFKQMAMCPGYDDTWEA